MVGVDVGFENPMFACLEIDYEEADADPTGNYYFYYSLDDHYFNVLQWNIVRLLTECRIVMCIWSPFGELIISDERE